MSSSVNDLNPTTGSATTASVRTNFTECKNELNQFHRMSEDLVTVTGTADALVATFTNAPASLYEGLRVTIVAASNNATTTPTLDVNDDAASGAKTIVQEDGTALQAGNIVAGGYYDLIYDATATNWILMNQTYVEDSTLLKDADLGVTVQAYDADIPTVAASQAEVEAGTESALRSMSPLRVKQAIDALGSVPTGAVIAWMTGTAPTGYLHMNGASISTTTYAALFAVLGYTYGGSGGTFNLPDMRGKFPRGWANGSANDPDRASRTDRGDGTTGDAVGTNQDHQLDSHTHTVSTDPGSGGSTSAVRQGTTITSSQATTATGGNETRPININVMWCIKT